VCAADAVAHQNTQLFLHCAGRKVVERSDRISTFPRPDKPITLYEFEGCPFCRKVALLRKPRTAIDVSGVRRPGIVLLERAIVHSCG